ncbi:YciI family protein [Pseudoduganella violaceinigra]|uniref:YciI family protein n=1 Tax=Pseudoduganella violaceinigra TaxID=246602 RepID=UPI00042A6609|nr:YciI family protein [Pseudoduganella violaceinigra]
MRFMIIVRSNAISESDVLPDPAIVDAMTAYHERLAAAGYLVDANGLKPSSAGWRVQYKKGRPSVVDGPFAETKELIAGYTLIDVPSRDVALEWTRAFPAPFGERDCEIEVRRLFELDELEPAEAIARFRKLVPAR